MTSRTGERSSVLIWTGGNRVLAALPPEERASLRANLTKLSATSGQVLYEQGGVIDAVYFPETAVASLIIRMQTGGVAEVGTLGNESMVGLAVLLGADVSLTETLVQIPGMMQRMSISSFRTSIEELPHFRSVIAGCMNSFMAQVSQTAACNGLHPIEQRCARWLLLTHDRVAGAESFPLTHQFLSFMLSVRRAGVTEALGALTAAGCISLERGRITIVDRLGLEAACCECYAAVRTGAGTPFGDHVAGDSIHRTSSTTLIGSASVAR